MDLNEYFGFPEGTNAQMRYSNFYDMVDSNFPCQRNMSKVFTYEYRTCLKQINVTNNTTDLANLFDNSSGNKYIEGIENWDVSNVTTMYRLFYYCNDLLKLDLSNWNIGNVTNMGQMFNFCSSLTDLSFISNWDTSKVETMNDMFGSCISLETLGSIRCDSVTFPSYLGMFGYNMMNKLVNFGGLINFKSQMITDSLNQCPNLSYESCINVLNGLYDFTANNEVPTSTQGKLLVHQNFLDKVGEEISIATNKGWNVYA